VVSPILAPRFGPVFIYSIDQLQLVLNTTVSGENAIISGLAGRDALIRRYAAAAAARLVHRDASPLKQAMGSADSTIKQFAIGMAARAGISGT
jgi:hypothetical protein